MFRQQSKLLIFFSMTVFLMSCVHASKKNQTNQTQKQIQNQTQNMVQMNSTLPSLSADQKIIQELTGKPVFVSKYPAQAQLKNKPLSVQHYFAGKRAAEKKNYIIAIKQFNTVIKKYPKSAEVKLALVAKSEVYKEMGLSEPAQLNIQMANFQAAPANIKTLSNKQAAKKQTAKNQDKQKINQ